MIKSYWKQLLVILYIFTILALSATAKAKSETTIYPNSVDEELTALQNLIEARYKKEPLPNAFSTKGIEGSLTSNTVKTFDDKGVFVFDNQTQNIAFVSSLRNKIFLVKCNEAVKAQLDSDHVYEVKGYEFIQPNNFMTNSSNSKYRPSNLDNYIFNNYDFVYVTGVQIQR